jgi:hypothetical protein
MRRMPLDASTDCTCGFVRSRGGLKSAAFIASAQSP